jgi:hypothetical protein
MKRDWGSEDEPRSAFTRLLDAITARAETLAEHLEAFADEQRRLSAGKAPKGRPRLTRAPTLPNLDTLDQAEFSQVWDWITL